MMFLNKHEHRLYVQHTLETPCISFQLIVSCCTRTWDLAHLPPADRFTRCRWPKHIGTFRDDEMVDGWKTAILYLPDSGLQTRRTDALVKILFRRVKTSWTGWYYFRAEITLSFSLLCLPAVTISDLNDIRKLVPCEHSTKTLQTEVFY